MGFRHFGDPLQEFGQPFGGGDSNSNLYSYIDRVLAVAPANLIGYWPLIETTGTVAADYSGHGFNGTFARNVSVMGVQTGIGDGNTAPTFTPGSDYVNIYSAGFAAAFNAAEGTMQAWIRPAAGVLTDGATRNALTLYADNSNRKYLAKTAANQIWFNNRSGGTNKDVLETGYNADTNWLHLLSCWSVAGNFFKAYINGVQVGTTQTTLGTFVGALGATTTVIGALNTSFTTPWRGGISNVAVWDTPLTNVP